MSESSKILKIKVLMYHRVIPDKPDTESRWHYVTVSDFRNQMRLIDKLGYTPITFSDYQFYLEGKLTLPSKPIIITFDDGYLDTLTNAVPVLLELNMRAVIFVMGNRKLKSARWDELNDFDICPLMTDEEIRHVQKMGFEIGAHSLNHVSLTELTDNEIVHEVTTSKEAIENIIGRPIQTFSYPYGSVDERVKNVVLCSGFLFACGVYSGSAKFSESMMDFRRLAVNQSTSKLKFLATLMLPYQYLEWLYSYLKTKMVHDVKMDVHRNLRTTSTNGQSEEENFEIQNILNSN